MQISKQTFQRLDQNRDKQLTRQELLKADIDTDGQISKQEAQEQGLVLDDLPILNKVLENSTGMEPSEVLFNLPAKTKNGLQPIPVVQRIELLSQPQSPNLANDIIHPLPNLKHTGPIMVEVNNPEKVPFEGRLFSSRSVDVPVRFGLQDGDSDNRNFNVYAFSNTSELKVKHNGQFQSFRSAGQPVYQAVVLHNPGPQAMRVQVAGSGYSNDAAVVAPRLDPAFKNLPQIQNELKPGQLHGTRAADALLSQDQVTENFNINQEVSIPPGQALVVYTRVKPQDSDVRSGYQFKVLEPVEGQELAIDTLLSQNIGGQKPNQSNGQLLLSQTEYLQLSQTPLVDGGNHLYQGEKISEAVTQKVNDMNSDGQVNIQDLKAFNNAQKTVKKWSDVIALGRINGVKAHSATTSVIPPQSLKEGQALNLNFAVNTKISDTAGSLQDQSVEMLSVSQLPKNGKTVPANRDRIAHGNYNLTYDISTQLSNTGQTPRSVSLKIGSPSEDIPEDGQQKPKYQGGAFLDESSTRFTGPVQIVLIRQPGGKKETINAAVVHGRLADPQHLAQFELKPGEKMDVQVRFVIPTNSTGPQILNIYSE